MKKIIKNGISFLVIYFLFVGIIDAMSFTTLGDNILGRLTASTGYARSGSDEIKQVIDKVQKDDNCTKLIVGDSVCRQVFNQFQAENPEYCIAGSNQAITLAGQYLLIQSFLENHQEVTDIYLVILPLSFQSTLGTRLGYNYVVAPFAETDMLEYLEESTIEELENVYGEIFLNKTVVEFIDYSCINSKIYLNYIRNKIPQQKDKVMSEVNALYLEKIQRMCVENNIQLHLLAGPVAETDERKMEVKRLEEYIGASNQSIQALFENYFKSICYYEENMFLDGIHLGGEYANKDIYKKIIREIQDETIVLEDLILE